MERKRDEARRASAKRRATVARSEPVPAPADGCPVVVEIAEAHDLPVAAETSESAPRSTAEGAAEQQDMDLDLLHCLKGLGWRAEQARMAIEHSRGNAEATIEERLRAAIKFLGSRGRTQALRQAAMNRSSPARTLFLSRAR